MKIFDPTDWYWIVGGSTTQAYSSAAGDYVPVADTAFVEWKSDGTLPVQIDTEESLGHVLAQHLMRPVAAGVLDGYRDAHAGQIIIKVPFKLLFQMNNDIRVLKGQQPLTANQARNYVKGLM